MSRPLFPRSLPLALGLTAAATFSALAGGLPAGAEAPQIAKAFGQAMTEAQVLDRWEDPRFHFKVAAGFSKAGRFGKAAWHLEEALRLDPEAGRVHVALGKLFWRWGDETRAKQHWIRGEECARPDPRARKLLAKLAPELAVDPERLDDVAELEEVARYAADLRRQAEIQAALDAYKDGAGEALPLDPTSSRAGLEKLVAFGLLKRPGGAPSGEGVYVTDADGTVSSTAFGRAGALKNSPDALRNARGYVAAPEVVMAALRAGDPAAAELGLQLLSPADLRTRWDEVAGALRDTRNPWVLDQVCWRLQDDGAPALSPVMTAWLRDLARDQAGVEPGQRWVAMARLWDHGARDLPAIARDEFEKLLGAAFGVDALGGAVAAALHAYGAEAEDALLAPVLKKDGSRALGSALKLLAKHGTARSVGPLVDLLETGRARGYPASSEVLPVAALEGASGRAFGGDVAAWRGWLAGDASAAE